MSVLTLMGYTWVLGVAHKGRLQRGGGGLVKCGHLWTGEGKDPVDVLKLVLFFGYVLRMLLGPTKGYA